MKTLRLIALALLACAAASFALAQNADPNTAGPTKNDYRLRVLEPAEGATITGDRMQVIVDTEIPGERDVRPGFDTMPRPDVDVFLDDKLQGTMRDEKNVVDIDQLAPGPHTIVLLAKNRSGEIIDRKEIHVAVVAPKVAVAPAPVKKAPVRPPEPAAPAYVPPPPPPPAPVIEDLPQTGTSDPLLAAAGLALLLGGLAIRRFA